MVLAPASGTVLGLLSAAAGIPQARARKFSEWCGAAMVSVQQGKPVRARAEVPKATKEAFLDLCAFGDVRGENCLCLRNKRYEKDVRLVGSIGPRGQSFGLHGLAGPRSD